MIQRVHLCLYAGFVTEQDKYITTKKKEKRQAELSIIDGDVATKICTTLIILVTRGIL